MDYLTQSAQETKDLGRKIGTNLKTGFTVALYGDLGSGKTTFLQGLAEGLGVKRPILSPTFIIARDYPLKSGGRFYHFDWYRITGEKEARALGIEELFDDNIVAIEWADQASKILPKKRLDIYFKQGKEPNQRKIIVSKKLPRR